MLISLRWILFAIIIFISAALPDQAAFSAVAAKRLLWSAIFYLFTITVLSIKTIKKEKELLSNLLIYAFDIILGALLISSTGGIKSPFFPVIYILMLLNSSSINNQYICIGGIIYTIILTLSFCAVSGFAKSIVLYLKEAITLALLGFFPVLAILKDSKVIKGDVELEKAYDTSRKIAELDKEKDAALAEKTRNLISLIQIARMMAQTSRLSDLLELIVSKSLEMLNTRIGFLMLIKGDELSIIYSHGISEITKKVFNCKTGEGILGQIAKSGKSIRLSPGSPQIQNLTGTLEKIRNILAVPMITSQDNKLIGVLAVANLLTEKEFNETHEDYLKTLAADAAISIKNQILYENLEKSYFEMIQGLAQAVEARDPYTYGHIDRVSSYTVNIAKIMKLPQLKLEIIKKAAILHDLGKIGIPDNVLLKDGPLNDEERKIMDEHTLKAADILRDISAVNSEVIDIVKHHHEKYDGTGYPDGIKGDKIPLGAQIIAIADTYDAMTTDRPYRKGMSKEDALKIIKKESGTQFNPDVVSAFMIFIKSGRFA